MNFKEYLNLNNIAFLILITPFLMVLSRNIASPIFVLVTFLLVAGAWLEHGSRSILGALKTVTLISLVLLVLALVFLMVASVSWSSVPMRGLEATGYFFGNAVLFALCLASLSEHKGTFSLNGFAGSIIISSTAVLIVSELFFGSPVRTLLGGSNEPFRMNRAAVAITLFLPLILVILPRKAAGIGVGIVTVLAVGYSAFFSESESAKLAIGVVVLSLPVFALLKRHGIWILGAFVLVSFVFMPFLAPHAMEFVPEFIIQRLDYSAVGLRAEIWNAHSGLIANAPLLGHGMEASYVAADDYAHTEISPRHLGWAHPHNFAIQVWYELGAVGVALFSALMVMFFRSLQHVTTAHLPAILSTVAAVWTVSLVSHGAWQAWWWCLVALLSLLWLIELKSSNNAVEQADKS